MVHLVAGFGGIFFFFCFGIMHATFILWLTVLGGGHRRGSFVGKELTVKGGPPSQNCCLHPTSLGYSALPSAQQCLFGGREHGSQAGFGERMGLLETPLFEPPPPGGWR